MKKILFLLASVTAVDLASAQMLPPTLGGTYTGSPTPSYQAPGNAPPGSAGVAPYAAPGYVAPYAAPGYTWREQQANENWRNNTWREERANQDWRANNWRQQRANEDWRQREEYAKNRTPNNAIDRGFVGTAAQSATEEKKNPLEKDECGRSGVKSALPCPDYAKLKRLGAKDATKNNPIDRGYGPK